MDSFIFLAKFCPSLPIILEVILVSGMASLDTMMMNGRGGLQVLFVSFTFPWGKTTALPRQLFSFPSGEGSNSSQAVSLLPHREGNSSSQSSRSTQAGPGSNPTRFFRQGSKCTLRHSPLSLPRRSILPPGKVTLLHTPQ